MSSAAPPAHRGPALLRALDNVTPTPDGWVADCPVFGCPELLTIEPDEGHWHLQCDGEHVHDEIVAYLQCGVDLDDEATRRLWRAMMLAPSIEVLEALLKGQDVPRARLDAEWARRFGL